MNREGQFTETKDQVKKQKVIEKRHEEEIFDNFVDKVKSTFSEKYGLMMQNLDIEVVEISGQTYLLDVCEMSFEKLHDRDSKLKSERMYNVFQETYQHKNLTIQKDAINIVQIKSLMDCMKEVYNNTLTNSGIKKYLIQPKRDETSDQVFKTLKPKCPYELSELLSDQMSKKKFMEYCSNNLWKES